MQIKNLINSELAGWKKSEVIFLLTECLIIMCLSIYWKDSLLGIISATAGVAYSVCTGKGKLVAYLFGLINVVLYAFISFRAGYYGEVMLNVLYYLPMQFYGFYVWSKHINSETHEVTKLRMSNRQRLVLCIAILLGTLVYGYVLKLMGGSLPYVDSFSTVGSVFAMIISVKMYMEQWIIWLVVDVISVLMWMNAFVNGNESIATLIMWIVYVVNAIIMYFKWSNEIKINNSMANQLKDDMQI